MNKVLGFMIVTVFLMYVASAGEIGNTEITGVIYDATTYAFIGGATVTVNCDGNVQTTISDKDGQYSVTYSEVDCAIESSLLVSAQKKDLIGSNSGNIGNDPVKDNWDLGIVHVPLAPEFGVIIGMLTILSAVGIFFVVRKD